MVIRSDAYSLHLRLHHDIMELNHMYLYTVCMYTWSPRQAVLYFMDVWRNNRFCHLKIWNHSIERSIHFEVDISGSRSDIINAACIIWIFAFFGFFRLVVWKSHSTTSPSLETTEKSFLVPRVLRKEGWGAWAAATTQRWQQQPAKANFWLFKGWGLCCKRWGEFPKPSKQKSQKSDHPKLGRMTWKHLILLEGIMQRYQRWEIWVSHLDEGSKDQVGNCRGGPSPSIV